MQQRRFKIWLVGGGTGGHIMPLLAVGEILGHDKTVSLTYLGEAQGREAVLARNAGIHFMAIPSGKLRRYLTVSSVFLNIRDAFRLLHGMYKSYRLMRTKKPDL